MNNYEEYMSCEKHRKQARKAKIMVPFGFLFAIAFVTFIEYCPMGIDLWAQASTLVEGYMP